MAASSHPQRHRPWGALLVATAPPATGPTAADIRPLKPLWHIQQPWFWVCLTLALLLLAGLLLYLWRRRRQGLETETPEVTIPPHEQALSRLEQALTLLQQPKPFTVEVSDTVRVYLEQRFQLHAPERTTEEFLHELQSSVQLSSSHKQSLGVFLQNCDLIKFARYEPGIAELRELHAAAVHLVEETKPTAAALPSPDQPPLVFTPTAAA